MDRRTSLLLQERRSLYLWLVVLVVLDDADDAMTTNDVCKAVTLRTSGLTGSHTSNVTEALERAATDKLCAMVPPARAASSSPGMSGRRWLITPNGRDLTKKARLYVFDVMASKKGMA
jgi:hypothetical protein